uniref:Myb/SANT-like DNA-binding domain-containing protein n=1 Tax=Scophthalmus maximus TaxID=52904 RepID=A0A8D3E4Q8_SCOMX
LRAISREMGLQGLMSARQLKKKWGNLKEKYRMLKNPPQGMENCARPSSWRWFHLMDLAMSGRLDGTAETLRPSPLDEDPQHTTDLPPLSPADVELDGKLSALRDERRALEQEQAEFDRELIALERDRELLNRDTAALQRERAAVDRDRAADDRDRAFLDRDRAVLERDRAFPERDRNMRARLVTLFQRLVEKL